MSADRTVKSNAKRLFRASLVDGRLSESRVAAILKALDGDPPPRYEATLRHYLRLVRAEAARHHAVVEHAGAFSPETEKTLVQTLSQRYGRPISIEARPNSDLIAGLRIRVDCDLIDASLSGRLESLAAATASTH
ncbi:MAG: hypothetical protein EA425_15605 [Puniceicoccaceae bacterium]|nr:MAG: hypothetical protein EA425_15605 [Puniceicoccaceae bacterium]